MRTTMTTVVGVAVAALLLAGAPGASQALTPYDNFSVKPLDPDRWRGNEREFGPEAPNEEATRKIARGKARLDLTSYGRTDSDAGSAGTANVAIETINPAPITTWQADVTVKAVKNAACAANLSPTRSGARLGGEFFNDGTSPGPGDRTGDIFAGIESRRDTIAGDQIVGFLVRCTNAACTTSTTLVFHPFAAVWTKGVPNTFRIEWEPANDRFNLTVDAETFVAPYFVPDANPAVRPLKQLAAVNNIANCQSGPRASGTMKALFDNVMVNP